jgi:excisionase family DNA binding protein
MVQTLLNKIEDLNLPSQKTDEPEAPINVAGAAEFLSLDQQTIYRLLRAGQIPAHKKFSKWYFFKSELIAYLKSEK